MTLTEQQQKGQEILNTIIRKSWEDEAFKQKLISDPRAIIAIETGNPLDAESKTQFIVEDQTNTDFVYLNIPRKIDLNELELTDEQLEMVAGGDFVIVPGAVIAGIGTVSLIVAAAAYFSKDD